MLICIDARPSHPPVFVDPVEVAGVAVNRVTHETAITMRSGKILTVNAGINQVAETINNALTEIYTEEESNQ